MAYKVIEMFTDLHDDNHRYEVGDSYPRKGHKPSKARIEELLSEDNRRGVALIKEVKTKKKAKKKTADK